MIVRVIIDEILCTNIENVVDKSKVVSYVSFSDPVIDIRYDRIILRDSYEYCLIEMQGLKNRYVNLKVAKNGIAIELSLITYDFEHVESNLLYHYNNNLDGVPYFSFNEIADHGKTHYKLNNCYLVFLKYNNCVAIKFFKCDLETLYWIKTDNIFYGLKGNKLKAVVYNIPENEQNTFKLF
jgi:hypothetical protein